MRRTVAGAVVGLLVTALWVVLAPPALAATVYYVSTSGSDSAAGTSAAPFRTIQKCASVAVAGDTCTIGSGTYREKVTPANSGTASAPITFAPAAGGSVTVDGSDPVTGWTAYSGQIYRAGATIAGDVQGLQLFQGATSIPSARWPVTGTDLLHPNRATAGSGTTNNASTHISTIVDPAVAAGWTGATVTFWGGYQWLAQTGTVTSSSAGQFSFSGGTGQCDASPYDQLCVRPGTRYYLSNTLSALTAPGQWYYDASAHYVYYWAPGGGVPSNVTVKQRTFAFDLTDRNYVTVRGLNLFGATITTDATTMLDTAHPGLPADCNQVPDPSHAGTHDLIDSITVKYVSQFDRTGECARTDDVVSRLHLSDTGIVLNGSYNTLSNSSIAWSAGNGVAVLGNHNTVSNNLIHDTDYMGTYSAGVYVQGTDHTITRNTMYDSGQGGLVGNYFGDGIPATGVTAFTNNTISYNNVYDFGLLDEDGGGMYFCCSESAAGGSIDHNWVHDGLQPLKLGNGGVNYTAESGIYLDAGSQDFSVSHNVVWNVGGSGMLVNGRAYPGPQTTTQNIKVYNNTFAATPISFRAGDSFFPNLTGSELRNNVFTGTVKLNGTADPTQSNNVPSTSDPKFLNGTGADFRVGATSPAIDAGTPISGVTDGYVGAAPDAGAYEYGGDQWVPGCNLAGCGVPTDSAHSIDDTAFTTSGTWTRSAQSLGYNNTQTYGNAAGATLTATFTGTQAQLYGVLSNVGGYGEVSVDGGEPSLVDFYATQGAGDTILYTTPVLASGTHTVTVKSLNRTSETSYTYVAVDRLTYTGASATSHVDDATSGVADQSINYVGSGWFHCTVNCNATYGATFYNGTATGDNVAGDKAYMFFTGTQASLIGFVGTNGQTTPTVSIDGGPPVAVTFYNATTTLKSVLQTPALPWGHHSLRLTVGTPTANYASFDEVVVTG